tara:strand:+ start:2894 stop:3151 length:258 start_codon:yes stop_codon:yes gene_type:complete
LNGAKWVQIEESFTEKYGWDKGIDYLLEVKRSVIGGKMLIDTTMSEEYKLVQELRKFYNVKKGEQNAKKKKSKKESSSKSIQLVN